MPGRPHRRHRNEGGIGTLVRLDAAARDESLIDEQRLGIGGPDQGLQLWPACLRVEHDRGDPVAQQSQENPDRRDVVVRG